MDPLSLISGLTPIVSKILDFIPDPAQKQRAELEMQTKLAEFAAQQAQQQSAINEKEADNPNLWVSGWRPAVGWVCGLSLAYSALIEPFMRFAATVVFNYGGAFPAIDTNLTLQILLGLLGLGAMRSFDKKQGTSK